MTAGTNFDKKYSFSHQNLIDSILVTDENKNKEKSYANL